MATSHEFIEFTSSEFVEVGDSIIVQGLVTSIDKDNNTLDCNTGEFGPLVDVPIFYHCEGLSTVADGWQAFDINDNIMIFCKNGRNEGAANAKVVGFWDGRPRDCFVGEGYIVAELSDYFTVWSIEEKAFADDIIDDHGHLILTSEWPYDRSKCNEWFDTHSENIKNFPFTNLGLPVAGCPISCYCPTTQNCQTTQQNDSCENPWYSGEFDNCSCSYYNCSRPKSGGPFCPDLSEEEPPVDDCNAYREWTIQQDSEFDRLASEGVGTKFINKFAESRVENINGEDVVIGLRWIWDYRHNGFSFRKEYRECELPCAITSCDVGWKVRTDSFVQSSIRTPWGAVMTQPGGGDWWAIDHDVESGSEIQNRPPEECDFTQGHDICNAYIFQFDNDTLETNQKFIARLYQEPVDDPPLKGEGHVLACIVATFQRREQWGFGLEGPEPLCTGTFLGYEPTSVWAVGTFGWFPDNSIPDMNDMSEVEDFSQGVVDLIQKHLDENGFTSIFPIAFRHRKGVDASSASPLP